MDNKRLRRGKKVQVTLYRGPSIIEAEATYAYLHDHLERLDPVPLSGSDLKIKLEEVTVTRIPGKTAVELDYVVQMKGVLV